MENGMMQTCHDILAELRSSILSSEIPYQQKAIIEEQIDILRGLLWNWFT